MIDDRLPYFHCFPSKLLGALAQLTPDQKLVYLVVLLRIYEVRGPIPDSIEALATRVGINKRRVSEALDVLFKAGKLAREGNGIMNQFALEVLARGNALHETRQRAGAEGGRRSWEKVKRNQQKPKSQAQATPDNVNEKEESLFPDGNRASAEPAPVLDERTKLWREGVDTLVRITGRPAGPIRSLVGKWLKALNDDCTALRRIIEDAARDRPGEPVPWIEAAVRKRSGGRGSGPAPKAGSAHLALKRFNREQEQNDDRTDDAGEDVRRSLPAPHA